MDSRERSRRYFEWKDYCGRNEDKLMDFAAKNGFDEPTAKKEFITAEAFSRTLTVKAIREHYQGCQLIPKPLRHHYDFDLITEDGEQRGVEGKFRTCDSTEYPTDDISLNKKEWIDEGKPIDLVNIFYDGVVRAYDLNGPSTTSTWTHLAQAAVESRSITDERLQFKPEDAIWTTTVSVPLN